MNTKNGKIRVRINKSQIINCYSPNEFISSYLFNHGIPVDELLFPKNGSLESWQDEMTNQLVFEWRGNLNYAGNKFHPIPKKKPIFTKSSEK